MKTVSSYRQDLQSHGTGTAPNRSIKRGEWSALPMGQFDVGGIIRGEPMLSANVKDIVADPMPWSVVGLDWQCLEEFQECGRFGFRFAVAVLTHQNAVLQLGPP